jgi:glycosyltransferase involved in cell wall biosynthesis
MSDLLFISTNSFNGLPTRKQRLANYLKGMGFRVLFVEPPFTYLAILKKREFLKEIHNINRLIEIDNNLFLLKSFPWFPFFKKYQFINNIDNSIFLNHLMAVFKEINFKPAVTWSYMPFLPGALKEISGKKVYDCVDNHSAYPGFINATFVDELERKTVKLSDLVITTNNELKEKISKYGKNAVVISNGVDWNLFSSNILNGKINIKNRITYVGAISEWFDIELVEFIADKFSDYEIILIGPCSINIDRFKTHKNIKLLGKMKQDAFVPILSESAVAIVPFRINELTKKVDALKIYEYLAAGVPVVSTEIGGANNLPILIGKDKDSFAVKITEAIKNDSIEKRIERSLEAKKFSWEIKYSQITNLLNSLF